MVVRHLDNLILTHEKDNALQGTIAEAWDGCRGCQDDGPLQFQSAGSSRYGFDGDDAGWLAALTDTYSILREMQTGFEKEKIDSGNTP